MELNLKNPIIFFDLETTGPDVVKDRIIEISYLKIMPNGKETTVTRRVKPEIPVSPNAYAVHGISNEELENEPSFVDIAKDLVKEFEGCDLAGFNSNKFDIPVLVEEFLRVGIDFDMKKRKWIDVQVIFHKMEQRTLSAAYKFYCDKNLTDAHSAEADTKATYEVLKAMLDRYQQTVFIDKKGNKSVPIKNSVDELSVFSSHNRNVDFAGRIILNDQNEEVFNFGKYRGKKVEDVLEKDPAYYSWMMNNDFPLYTKKMLTNIKLRKFGQ